MGWFLDIECLIQRIRVEWGKILSPWTSCNVLIHNLGSGYCFRNWIVFKFQDFCITNLFISFCNSSLLIKPHDLNIIFCISARRSFGFINNLCKKIMYWLLKCLFNYYYILTLNIFSSDLLFSNPGGMVFCLSFPGFNSSIALTNMGPLSVESSPLPLDSSSSLIKIILFGSL